MPCTVRGLVMPDADGDYNIYINPCLSIAEQEKTLKHEMAHIESGDFCNHLSIDEIEERAKQK